MPLGSLARKIEISHKNISLPVEKINNFTHTILAEYGALSTCPHCPPASNQLYSIYNSGDYKFYYVSLVYNENRKTAKRLKELGISGVPDVYFDGKYTHVLGEQSDDQNYREAIERCCEREVADVNLDVSVIWKGNAILDITVTIKSNESKEYRGHLRAYIVEPISRWNDYSGKPFYFGFLDFAFDRTLSLKRSIEPLGDTYKFTTTWYGGLHGFGDISKDNIMVIAAIFNKDTDFVDDVAAATPSQSNKVGIENNGYINITVEEAWELIQTPSNGIQIPIDVRTPKEFINERIDTPSCREKPRLFPLQLMQSSWLLLRFFMNLYNSKEIILYCRTGHRSSIAAQILVEQGFEGTIYNMVGGITAWKDAGLPTVKGFLPLT